MIDDVFRQSGYDIRLEWGAHGVDALAGCGVLIIVDVLTFTTSVDIAVGRGARIRPLATGGGPARPASLTGIPAGTLLAMPSPNGATLCVRAAATGATVLAGCLRNATAVATAAAEHADGRPIGVIAAGERWGGTAGPLRPCVEDYLGAGAIVAALRKRRVGTASPEASVAAVAAQGKPDLAGCSSGRELIERGDRRDVELAAQLDISETVPILVNGVFG